MGIKPYLTGLLHELTKALYHIHYINFNGLKVTQLLLGWFLGRLNMKRVTALIK